MEVFKVDDVTSNDVIQKKQHLLGKEKLQISHSNHYCLISIFSIKLLKKTRNLVFISKWITSQFQYFLDWNLYDFFKVRSSNYSNCCRYACILASLYYFWQKVYNALLANIFTFQNLNSNTRVGYERCYRFIKITTKSTVVAHLIGLNKLTSCLSIFMAVLQKVSKCPVWDWQYFSADSLTYS